MSAMVHTLDAMHSNESAFIASRIALAEDELASVINFETQLFYADGAGFSSEIESSEQQVRDSVVGG